MWITFAYVNKDNSLYIVLYIYLQGISTQENELGLLHSMMINEYK